MISWDEKEITIHSSLSKLMKFEENLSSIDHHMQSIFILVLTNKVETFFSSYQAVGSSPVRGETVAKLKVAINGFGRIGRNFLRCWHGRKDSPLDVVVVNDSGGVKNVSNIY